VLGIHVSLGFFVFLFVAWRVGFRLYEGFPANVGQNALERWSAYAIHRVILLLLALQVITGPMYLFTENECVNVFNWFSVCVPLESLSVIHEPHGVASCQYWPIPASGSACTAPRWRNPPLWRSRETGNAFGSVSDCSLGA